MPLFLPGPGPYLNPSPELGVNIPAAGGTTFDTTGALIAGTVALGDDVFEAVETGNLIADTACLAADVFEAVEAGSLRAGTLTAAVDVFEAVEVGSLKAGTVAKGTDVFEAVETGAAIAGTKFVGTSQTISGVYPAAILAETGLLAYWRMGDTTGTTMVDSSGNGHNGTYVGSPTLAQTGALSGDSDTAVQFNGTSHAASAAVDLSATAVMSLEFWLKWDSYSNNDDLAFEYTTNWGNAGAFIVDPNHSGGNFAVGPGTGATFPYMTFTRPSAGVFHYYVIEIDRTQAGGSEVAVWVDGVSQTLTVGDASDASGNFANDTLYFMSRATSALFGAGTLDEVALYDRALTQTDIDEHYLAGTGSAVYEKTGAVVAGTVASAADVFEAVETAAVIAGSRTSAADVYEATETGAIRAGTQTTGTDVFQATETGSLVAGTRAQGADVFEAAETGKLIAGSRVSGADVAESSRTGVVAAGTRASGTDVFEAVETGSLRAGTLLRGSGQAGFISKLGALIAGTLTSAADAFTGSRTGALITRAVAVAADVFQATETGSLRAGARVEGTSQKTSPVIYEKAGTLTAGTRLRGVQVYQPAFIPPPPGLIEGGDGSQGLDDGGGLIGVTDGAGTMFGSVEGDLMTTGMVE